MTESFPKPEFVDVWPDGLVEVTPLGAFPLSDVQAALRFITSLDPDRHPWRLWNFTEATSFPTDAELASLLSETARSRGRRRQARIAMVSGTGIGIKYAKIAAGAVGGHDYGTFGILEGARAWLRGEEDAYFEEAGHRVEVSEVNGGQYLCIELSGRVDAEVFHDAQARANAPKFDHIHRRLWRATEIVAVDTSTNYADIGYESEFYSLPGRRVASVVASQEVLGLVNMILRPQEKLDSRVFLDEAEALAWLLDGGS